MKFLSSFLIRAKKVPVALAISDCRDPKDNKFLELANDGNTGYIITGDKDLLTLHPSGISIVTPAQFLSILLA
jgi:putative PIN family toxin of toxin-antitoxin system